MEEKSLFYSQVFLLSCCLNLGIFDGGNFDLLQF